MRDSADQAVTSHMMQGAADKPDLEILRAGASYEGLPVLFLHGYTSGAWQFAKYMMPALADAGVSSWALNLRGHGGSAGRPKVRKARFHDYTADVARAVDHIERETGHTPVLVGHSLGSVLARYHAAQTPVPGLAIVSFGDIKLGMKDFMVWMMRRFPMQGLAGMLTGRPSAMFARFEPQYAVMYDGQPREVVRANVERLMAQPDSDKVFMELRKLVLGPLLERPPVLVLAGDRDAIASPRSVSALASSLGTDPVILDGEAHDIFANPNWKRGFDVLLPWLESLRQTADEVKP